METLIRRELQTSSSCRGMPKAVKPHADIHELRWRIVPTNFAWRIASHHQFHSPIPLCQVPTRVDIAMRALASPIIIPTAWVQQRLNMAIVLIKLRVKRLSTCTPTWVHKPLDLNISPYTTCHLSESQPHVFGRINNTLTVTNNCHLYGTATTYHTANINVRDASDIPWGALLCYHYRFLPEVEKCPP